MVVVKPTSNVYTVLVILATVASVLAILVVMIRSKELFGQGLF
jgi:hypothetical protein